ncbi:zinc-dependent peptidase [Pontimicrobium sp. IMCC45349]|uniref:zinc-dependent peptidase n=1 Tax=Pontimicrobium sp. IMCC45349 TaxID=3391574 RepID=UPI0039A078F7
MLQDIPEETVMNPILRLFFLFLFFGGMAAVVLSRFYVFFEQVYASKYKKPFFLHKKITYRQLSKLELAVLESQFSFYNKLTAKEKKRFQHRVSVFINNKQFVGRQDLELTTDMYVLISATAVMLTFGFRKYLIDLIDVIIVYPEAFYSTTNETHHKGEFNPKLKSLVISWQHFKEGYDIENDNLNLGVHEFAHAIHLSSFNNEDISAIIFNESFQELTSYLSKNESLRLRLIESKYFREYAYTNQYEFIAVIIENFIETPKQFKAQFPQLYLKTKQMLNFNFAGY